jgi:hypothetical protein
MHPDHKESDHHKETPGQIAHGFVVALACAALLLFSAVAGYKVAEFLHEKAVIMQ